MPKKNKNSPEKCQKVPTCAKLECIASEIRENGGKFSSSRMLDDTKDCLQALNWMILCCDSLFAEIQNWPQYFIVCG